MIQTEIQKSGSKFFLARVSLAVRVTSAKKMGINSSLEFFKLFTLQAERERAPGLAKFIASQSCRTTELSSCGTQGH